MVDPSHDKSNEYTDEQPYGLLVKNTDRKVEKPHQAGLTLHSGHLPIKTAMKHYPNMGEFSLLCKTKFRVMLNLSYGNWLMVISQQYKLLAGFGPSGER